MTQKIEPAARLRTIELSD